MKDELLMIWIGSLYLFMLIFRPFEYWPWLQNLYIERITLITLIIATLITRNKKWHSSPINISIVLLLIALGLSTFDSDDFITSFNIFYEMVKFIILYYIFQVIIVNIKFIVNLILSYLCVMFLYVGKSSWEFFINGRHVYRMGISRMVGIDTTLGDPNAFAASIVYSLPFAILILYISDIPRYIRNTCIVYITISITALLFTGSRSGQITALLFFIMFFATSSRKIYYIVSLFLAIVLTWNFMPENYQQRFISTFDHSIGPANAAVSADSRIALLKNAFDIFKEHPWLGVGPGMFSRYVDSGLSPHSLYGQLLSEHGFIGTAVFTFFLFTLFRQINLCLKINIAPFQKFNLPYNILPQKIAIACLQTIILMLCNGLASHNFHRFNWFFVAAIITATYSIFLNLPQPSQLKRGFHDNKHRTQFLKHLRHMKSNTGSICMTLLHYVLNIYKKLYTTTLCLHSKPNDNVMIFSLRTLLYCLIFVFSLTIFCLSSTNVIAAEWKKIFAATLQKFPELSNHCDIIEHSTFTTKPRTHHLTLNKSSKLDQDDTEYTLVQDITDDGTALTISASKISLNLNGHTVFFGAASNEESHGIVIEGYNRRDIQICCGTIEQANPLSKIPANSPIHFPHGIYNYEISNLTVLWNSPQTSGINAPWGEGYIHDNILIDQGSLITNRHQEISTIQVNRAPNTIVANNAIVRARQTGIFCYSSNTVCENNTISIDSQTTNSYGILYYGHNPTINHWNCQNNIIKGSGIHPIGIGVVSQATGGRVSGNHVEVQCTLPSEEYGKSVIGAAAYRTTWGANDILVDNNTFIVHGAKSSINGSDAWGRAVWVALNKGDHLRFVNNTIQAVSSDPSVKVAGIAVTGNNDSCGLVFENNTVESTWATVVLGDDYGYAKNYPLFIANTFRKIGENPNFQWVRDDYRNVASTGFFIDNSLQGIGDNVLSFSWDSTEAKTLYFGRLASCHVAMASGQDAANVTLTVRNAAGEDIAYATTGQDGRTMLPIPVRVISNRGLHGEPMGQRIERPTGPLIVHATEGTQEASLELQPDTTEILTLHLNEHDMTLPLQDTTRPRPADNNPN